MRRYIASGLILLFATISIFACTSDNTYLKDNNSFTYDESSYLDQTIIRKAERTKSFLHVISGRLFGRKLGKRDYLIISNETFSDTIKKLVDYRSKDFSVIEEYVSPSTSKEEILKIIEPYASPTLIVVLIGRCDQVACPIEEVKYSYRNSAGVEVKVDDRYLRDNYYADLNKDVYPDFTLARIPVDSKEELDAVIDKTITYEKNQYFKKNSYLFVGGSELSPDERVQNPYNGWKTISFFDEEIIPLLGANQQVERIACYCHNKREECSENTELLLNALNEGVWLMAYKGHGYNQGIVNRCCEEGFDVDDIHNGLKNENNYPIFISLSCNNSDLLSDYKDGYQSFGEEAITVANKGFVAFIGSTGINGSRMIEGLAVNLFQNLSSGNYTILGDAMRDAQVAYELFTIPDKYIDDRFELFGDPALKIQ